MEIYLEEFMSTGCLFIVATPIGNLGDITQRALETLRSVDFIAAEDTRHSKKLLNYFHIDTRMMAYHDHNDQQALPVLMKALQEGKHIALISDAGTPLISDPGYPLVAKAHELGIRVIPIPGACAAIAALAASGIPSQPFRFTGFPPQKTHKRDAFLDALSTSQETTVLYESVHRIAPLIESLKTALEPERQVSVARELTKQYESILTGSIDTISKTFSEGKVPLKGEFVVVIGPKVDQEEEQTITLSKESLLTELLSALSLSDAVSLYCSLTKEKRNTVYQEALKRQA